jgi:hypothetical protein
MGAPDASERSHLPEPAGLDHPHLPDFATFRAARERFLQGLADSKARGGRDAARAPGTATVLDLDSRRSR